MSCDSLGLIISTSKTVLWHSSSNKPISALDLSQRAHNNKAKSKTFEKKLGKKSIPKIITQYTYNTTILIGHKKFSANRMLHVYKSLDF